jgi:hypothetical protein
MIGQCEIKALKKARKQTIELGMTNRLDEEDTFKSLIEEMRQAYIGGAPVFEYQVKPHQIAEHMSFWQKHLVWGELITCITDRVYTKTSTTLIVYFKN